jgi:hypothetical protein
MYVLVAQKLFNLVVLVFIGMMGKNFVIGQTMQIVSQASTHPIQVKSTTI